VASTLDLWRAAYLADVLVDRGDLTAAAGVLDATVPDERVTMNFRLPWLYARARVDLEAGRLNQALAGFATLGRVLEESGFHNPAFLPCRSLMALTLHRVGRPTEALQVAQEELELARRWGAPRTSGSHCGRWASSAAGPRARRCWARRCSRTVRPRSSMHGR
jgi:hypothetical protein